MKAGNSDNMNESIRYMCSPCRIGIQQLQKLKKFGRRMSEYGFDFVFCDAQGQSEIFYEVKNSTCDIEKLIATARKTMDVIPSLRYTAVSEPQVIRPEKEDVIIAPIQSLVSGKGRIELHGMIIVKAGKSTKVEIEIVKDMVILLIESIQADMNFNRQIETIGSELSHTYEELVLLHKISSHMKVTESDSNFLQMACDYLTDLVNVEGIAVIQEKIIDNQKRLMITAGSGLIDIDEQMAAILFNRLIREVTSGREALLDSEVDSPFKYRWADHINNIIAVPLFGKEKKQQDQSQTAMPAAIIGVMVAINRIDKLDFDMIDVKLFNSVANSCAVFIENSNLFKDLQELFIGSLKALTSSIDAKDQYTRGHSERVAFISRWIAEKAAEKKLIDRSQIDNIYLSGLLHDIGKMGVNEAVLKKSGRLSSKEYECIKKHPSIGAGILSGIKQMKEIVPGVLYHHERFDGKGYPDGLAGSNIPLIGRIICLADSFDAMTSRRTYRNAMSVRQAMEEIEINLGKQFDPDIGRIFLDSDIYQLWDMMQGGYSEIGGYDKFAEYGTVAVGTLIQ